MTEKEKRALTNILVRNPDGIPVDATDYFGWTALHHAVSWCRKRR